MKFYDISYTLSNNTPIYPGNPDFNIERFLEIPKDQSNVSLVSFGTHTATHIDAPFHVNNEGQTIDKINIERFFGKCNVLDISFSKNKITREDLEKYEIKNDFLLIKTNNSNIGFDEFHEDFIYLDLSAAEYIKEKGIKFIGVDGPSVKKFHEKDLIHEFFFKNDIIIAENLKLKDVSEGEYLFVGFPLKIAGADASPARIILVENYYE